MGWTDGQRAYVTGPNGVQFPAGSNRVSNIKMISNECEDTLWDRGSLLFLLTEKKEQGTSVSQGSAKREADLKLRARLLPELYDTR